MTVSVGTGWAAVVLLLAACRPLSVAAADAPAAAGVPATAAVGYQFFSLPIDVEDLPETARHMPRSARIEFARVLAGVDSVGVVDERSLRLFRRNCDGSETEIAVQFLPDERPRLPTRRFLPDTVEGVSYVGEFPSQDLTNGPQPAGILTWLASGTTGGRALYRLQFAQATLGRAVQVPYAPANLRVFDDQGRATASGNFPRLQIRPQWPLLGHLNVLDNRRPVTTYHLGPSQDEAQNAATPIRRPFLYPVHDPDGYALTELGKPHDPTGSHRHHYSLWIAHADVSGHDFWSDRGGIIAHEAWELLEDGPVFCRIAVRLVWIAAGTPILRERRTMTFYRTAETVRTIDFELEYQPASTEDVQLGSTTFGFLSVRTAASMTPFDGGGEIINARGQRNEQAAHRQRAEWLDLSGPVDQDRWSGIALLDHPGNLNHPTAWHCRNDGWACAAVNHERPHTLRGGEKLALKYRILLHRGDARAAAIADGFRFYAAEPQVRIGTARRGGE